jgi:uncharacterized protein
MKTRIIFLFVCMIAAGNTIAQVELSKVNPAIFEKLMTVMKAYKPDTSNVPDDRMTDKINELRNLRGGFNIYEAIEFKLQEDRHKNEITAEDYVLLSEFFKKGDGQRWLNNAIVWIYRNHFTRKELNRLVKFYKTSAGQKMADEFPVIIMKSLAAAQMMKDLYPKGKK